MSRLSADSDAGGEQLHSGRRTLAVLEAIAAQPHGVTPKQVSQTLKLHLSTCYRLLNTLLAAGYLVKSSDGHFTLGRRVAYLNNRYEASLRPNADARAFLHALQLATGETSMLCRLEADEVVTTAVVPGSRPGSHPGGYLGLSGPAHAFAAGRALLAGLPPAQREAAIARCETAPDLPWLPRVTPQALRDDLDHVRQQGYAVDAGEGNAADCCYAAPIHRVNGDAASVAVIAPCARLLKSESRVLTVLLEVARAIAALDPLPDAVADMAPTDVSQAAIDAAQAAIADAMSRVS